MEAGKEAIPKVPVESSTDLQHVRQTDATGRTQSQGGQKMATGNLERINRAISNNSTEDEHNDMIMMSNSRVNWEDFLQAAPLSITLLGQLMVLASTKDFKLPASASKEFKHSESFRGSLVEISNKGWEAFNEAHTNMHQIQMSSASVQRHVKRALGVISKGTLNDVKYLLPRSLKSIETIVNDCLTLSSATEMKFVNVMGLIGSVLESCTEAKGQYEDDLRKTKAALQVATESKVFAEKEHEESTKQLAKMEEQLKKAREVYEEAMKEMPAAGTLIGAMFLENITTWGGLTTMGGANDESAGSAGSPRPDDVEQSIKKKPHSIYKHAEKLSEICTKIAALVKKSDDSDSEKEQNLDVLALSAEDLKDKFSDEAKSQEKKDALHVCKQAISLCENLTNQKNTLKAQNSDDHKKVSKKNIKLAQEMEKSCKEFLDKSIEYSSTESIPSERKTNTSSSSKSSRKKSAHESIVDAWQTKLSGAQEQLNKAQQQVDEAQHYSRETSKPLYDIILKISQCNLEKINFDEICDTLVQGIHALAEVREQWGKLVRFFQEISNLIKCTLNTSLKEFTETVTDGSRMMLEDYIKLSDYMLDMIYMQAFTASKVARVIHHVASMYMEVSKTAIMDNLASLPKLLVLKNDSGTSTTANMEKLMSNCEQTQKVIREMVAQKQEEFVSAISDQINHIKCELGAVLPADGENYGIVSESTPSLEHNQQDDMSSQTPI